MASKFTKFTVTAVGLCTGSIFAGLTFTRGETLSAEKNIPKEEEQQQQTETQQKEETAEQQLAKKVKEELPGKAKPEPTEPITRPLPTRKEILKGLQTNEYDVLIIGGGAIGTGCALDAATRGLKTALVEAEDFASGTSSKSTKLVHGGLRYLHNAVTHFDIAGLKTVRVSLRERNTLLRIAPHLNQQLPIMVPIHHMLHVPYYWFGIKFYDWMGSSNLNSSYYIRTSKAAQLFPYLKNETLWGAMVYHEVQHDDARMCLSVALTAARYGADICNHLRVKRLIKVKNQNNRVIGVRVKDEIGGSEFDIKAKCVINCTGPFTDGIRQMENPTVRPICGPSAGVHVVLPAFYSPNGMGLFDPAAPNGRVIFFLPWQQHTIVGTTDRNVSDPSGSPSPSEDEVQYILNEIKQYLNASIDVRRGDVLSTWSGLRPLVYSSSKSKKHATKHVINLSRNKMITVAGGKFSTYRIIAEETINEAIKIFGLKPKHMTSITKDCKIEGAAGWTPNLYIRLVQDYGLDRDVAEHLASTYGSNAYDIVHMAYPTGQLWPVLGKRLHNDFPYIQAEILQGLREYACTAEDMIARRFRIAFLNVHAADEILPNVVNAMGKELNWSLDEKKKQLLAAQNFLSTQMGSKLKTERFPLKMTAKQVRNHTANFRNLDADSSGYLTINAVHEDLKNQGINNLSPDQLHEVLKDIDGHTNGKVNLYEYLMLMSAVVNGDMAYLRYARMSKDKKQGELRRKYNSEYERSGGGL